MIATGASENGGQIDFGLYDDGPDTMADFSSRGPCEDGRIKPDVVAPGTFVASLLSGSASDQFAWLPIDNYYIYMGGTSQAGPHASGAAAVFMQYYKTFHTNTVPSPALVKAALINSAQELDETNGGPGPVPNNDEGWGRVNIANIIGSPRSTEYVDQTALLTNGQFFDHHTFVQSSDMPLKITLAYTDVPGFPGALPALVNDLDLEVTGPDGTLYRGNQFDGNDSIPNATVADNINNVRRRDDFSTAHPRRLPRSCARAQCCSGRAPGHAGHRPGFRARCLGRFSSARHCELSSSTARTTPLLEASNSKFLTPRVPALLGWAST